MVSGICNGKGPWRADGSKRSWLENERYRGRDQWCESVDWQFSYLYSGIFSLEASGESWTRRGNGCGQVPSAPPPLMTVTDLHNPYSSHDVQDLQDPEPEDLLEASSISYSSQAEPELQARRVLKAIRFSTSVSSRRREAGQMQTEQRRRARLESQQLSL